MLNDIRDFIASHVETPLVSGFMTWVLIAAWMWFKGWKVQRRYFIASLLTPLRRIPLWWMCAIIGAVMVVAAEQRPASPALVAVAMVGVVSSVVDARTHQLPDTYTAVMACGVISGIFLAGLTAAQPFILLGKVMTGALLWLVPLWCASRIPHGMGKGDVKLAPVLGAMLGILGIQAALTALILSFVAAGLAALTHIVTGQAGTDTRIPMGPWLIGSALLSYLLWGVIPDWL
ncbi:prepilin peptidase [Schaalia sp. lx-100]|uniref:prepilin peptidase n=1 Tax=Schaalia sp. lx-100 TaxID=2899081 RepID=UPI001E28404B|nr:A24 family peptidase [Schaalia sp. lx-100]MCD4557403.1 A24 family peptidase [Schaalia sp. lx-100]